MKHALLLLLSIFVTVPVAWSQGVVLSSSTFKWHGTPDVLMVASSSDSRPICVGQANSVDARGQVRNTQMIACRGAAPNRCPSAQDCFNQQGKNLTLTFGQISNP